VKKMQIRFQIAIGTEQPEVFGTDIEFDMLQPEIDKIMTINQLADGMRATLFQHFKLGEYKPLIEVVKR